MPTLRAVSRWLAWALTRTMTLVGRPQTANGMSIGQLTVAPNARPSRYVAAAAP